MNYGISYMGSKSAIAKNIVDLLPAGNRFVDLFGGGFAISHYVLVHHIYNNQLSFFGKKWNKLLYNDFNPLIVDVVKRAINGDFNYNKFKPKFIWKQDFERFKDKDGYIKSVWSFGNNGRDYMYSDEIVKYKYACHQAIAFNAWGELKKLCPEVWEDAHAGIKNIEDIKHRRLRFASAIVKKLKKLNDWGLVQSNPLYKSCHWRGGKLDGKQNDLQSLESLERLERLESLERLERLQSLERLERLEIMNISYEDYVYQDGDVVYCDIPYENTCEYSNKFDHKKFYEWVYSRDYSVFFSSYDNISDKRFKCIWKMPKRSTLSSTSNTTLNIECVYTND